MRIHSHRVERETCPPLADLRSPTSELRLLPVKRHMVQILGPADPCEQPGRGVAARHRARRGGRHHRRLRAVHLRLVFWAHDLALEEFRRGDLHLEGPFLADLLVDIGVRLHRLGLDDHHLQDGQLLKRLLRRGAALGRRSAPLVAHGLHRALGLLRGGLQLLERERELRAIQLLALARSVDQLAQLLQLPAQVSTSSFSAPLTPFSSPFSRSSARYATGRSASGGMAPRKE